MKTYEPKLGIGQRFFFFDDNGTIKRIPNKIYNELRNNPDSDIQFPEYAGKRVRSALVFVATRQRKPVKISDIECTYMSFNSQGRVDQEAVQQELDDTLKLLPPPSRSSQDDILESLKPDLASLKYRDKYKWKMTPAEFQHLEEKIF